MAVKKGFETCACNYCKSFEKLPWEMATISMCFDCKKKYQAERQKIRYERVRKNWPKLTKDILNNSINVIIAMYIEGVALDIISQKLLIDIRFIEKQVLIYLKKKHLTK